MTTPVEATSIRDYPASLIRTFVPVWVGAGITFLSDTLGPVDVDPQMGLVLAGAVASIYYAAVRKLEVKYPKLGWLLGMKGTPVYLQR